MSIARERLRESVGGNVGLVVAGLFAAVLLADLGARLVSGEQPLYQLLLFSWQGLYIGIVLGLAGIGLSLTYSILGFANFSHGDLLTVGAFSGWSAAYVVAGLGTGAGVGDLLLLGETGHPAVTPGNLEISVLSTPLVIAVGLLMAVGGTILVALVIDRYVYKPMRDEKGISLLIASIGVALALRYLVAFIWQTGRKGLTASVPSFRLSMESGNVTFTAHQITLVAIAVVLVLGLHFTLQRTKLGKAMRAMADNEDLARVTGIPTERVVFLTWVIGAGMAGAAGYLLALTQGSIQFTIGWSQLLLVFSAVILGGIGSVYGAIVGGIVIGMVSRLALLWFPSEFGTAAAFFILILVLLYRPSGIFGGVRTA
jgi:branched-chain amino acid transport system permease protein